MKKKSPEREFQGISSIFLVYRVNSTGFLDSDLVPKLKIDEF